MSEGRAVQRVFQREFQNLVVFALGIKKKKSPNFQTKNPTKQTTKLKLIKQQIQKKLCSGKFKKKKKSCGNF